MHIFIEIYVGGFFMDPSMTADCREVAISNDYEDFIIEYSLDPDIVEERLKPVCFEPVGARYGVFHQPRDAQNDKKYVDMYGYNYIPELFGLLDTTSVESAGVLKVRRQPYLNLYGRGVLIGFVDTGIDYQNPLFLNEDGTTRIFSIWDQADQTGNLPRDIYYGSEYTREMINEALRADDPLSIVPSTDTNGHGTFMAGIAAGNIDNQNDFTGVAPQADIIVVKLKEAKPYLKSLYGISQDRTCYASNDILMGIHYIYQVARREKKPLVLCLGVGSNSGDHTGRGVLSSYLDDYGDVVGNCTVIAAGNEGNRAHHFSGELEQVDEMISIEVRVGANEPGFFMEIWGTLPYLFSTSIISPTGQVIPRINAKVQPNREYNLTFEDTTIDIRYDIREPRTGDQLVFLRFKSPTEGIWTVNVYADTAGKQTINAWLPMEQLISSDTYFIRPQPDITITQPGNTDNTITVAAYNHTNGAIYISSSRGPTRDNRQEPTITAPGVEVFGPVGRNRYGTRSGTSVAAANVAGAAALIMEWGIVKNNSPYLSTISIRQLLVSGASRSAGLEYPNNIWGYGTINLYDSFDSIRLTT